MVSAADPLRPQYRYSRPEQTDINIYFGILGQGPEETVGRMASQGTLYIKNRLQYTLELILILPYHICIFVQPQECENYPNRTLTALHFSQIGNSSAIIF
jgi:hypothetical protein